MTNATATFYAEMAIEAARRFSRLGGGWRLYVLGKSLDTKGLGMVRRDELSEFALSLGVNVRTFQRWMKQARNNDLLFDVQKGAEWWLILPSAGNAAAAMGCGRLTRKVTMLAADLIGNGWKARVWGAYEAIHNGKPITREKMQKIVNVPVSTQRYRDSAAGVTRTRNYSKTDMRGDMLPGLQEHGARKGIYVGGDGFIYWRLPNSYSVNFAMRGGRGRSRKANRIIRSIHSDGLFSEQQALSQDFEYSEVVRLFNVTTAQRKSSMKKLAKMDNRPVMEVYEHARRAKTGAEIWIHCPV